MSKMSILFFYRLSKMNSTKSFRKCILSFFLHLQIVVATRFHQSFKALFLPFLKYIWKIADAFRLSPSAYGKGIAKLQLQKYLTTTSCLCCHPKSVLENGQDNSGLWSARKLTVRACKGHWAGLVNAAKHIMHM